MNRGALALAAVALAAMLARGNGRQRRRHVNRKPQCDDVREALRARGYSETWERFFMTIVRHESGCVVNALNTGDAWAARAAYKRNRKRLNRPAREYLRGSMGLFQFIPANAMVHWPDARPVDVLWTIEGSIDAAENMVAYIMDRPEFKAKPVWGRLLVGWGRPNHPDSAEGLAKWRSWFAKRDLPDFTEEMVD